MQVEPIINARFKQFKESHELTNLEDGLAFERFVNYSILSVHQPGLFAADSEILEKVCVGGRSDMGIDGLAIKINGLIVTSKQEIDDIINSQRRVNVEFIFIQSKYKPKFNKGELNNFVDGVRDFLSDDHNFPMNDFVKEFLELKEYLLSDDIMVIWDSNPKVILYYVAMGRWREAEDLVGVSKQFSTDLSKLNIYQDSNIHFVDSESLKNIYDSISNTFSKTIDTRHTMPLTDVKGVTNSCMAIVYASEFIKILETEDGIIRRSLFNDNVRDYQGDNSVNSEIEDTLANSPAEFIVLNNGLTVVCDEFKQNNTRLTISNPQIVNGCQTSHVIFNAYKKGINIENVPLTVKFISTVDLELSNQIVRGTNRQNIVLEEAFEATKQFHKDLEEFFVALSQDYETIYYERRSKQYSYNPTIKQTQKFSLKLVTQYFLAMYLNKPHFSHRHESVLLKDFANDLFQDYHSKLPYFTTALCFYNLEKVFRERAFSKNVKAYKAHLLMMFRESVGGFVPNINKEKPIDNHSQKILDILKDYNATKKRFLELELIFEDAKEFWINTLHKSPFRMKDQADFTDVLLDKVRNKYNIDSQKDISDSPLIGKVIKTSIDRYGQRFGFILRQPENVFFHSLQNNHLNFEDLEGSYVSYELKEDKKTGKQFAINISKN